ncbi:Uncharacterized protein PPKH_4900 [Pseudomonas putida]|nr:Uncharacterized protein PPKH_4900 [Pseudomonas putida]
MECASEGAVNRIHGRHGRFELRRASPCSTGLVAISTPMSQAGMYTGAGLRIIAAIKRPIVGRWR